MNKDTELTKKIIIQHYKTITESGLALKKLLMELPEKERDRFAVFITCARVDDSANIKDFVSMAYGKRETLMPTIGMALNTSHISSNDVKTIADAMDYANEQERLRKGN